MEEIRAVQIVELLRHRHPAPEWATFSELAHGTGGYLGGRFDFFAFNLWPSKGYLRVVYEVKISRNDFAKELSQPLKRREAELYANECFFATPVGLVQTDELPEGWGLIEWTKGGLRVKKRAMQRKVDDLPLTFVASLARRSTEPPSPLPELFWKYAGEELSLEQLIQAAKENIESITSDARVYAVSEFKRSDNYRALVALMQVVRNRLGYAYTEDAQKLDQWFTEHDAIRLDTGTKQRLEDVRDRINELLEEQKEISW